MVRLHGHLGQIGMEEGYIAIKEALLKEEDPEVRAELEKAAETYILNK